MIKRLEGGKQKKEVINPSIAIHRKKLKQIFLSFRSLARSRSIIPSCMPVSSSSSSSSWWRRYSLGRARERVDGTKAAVGRPPRKEKSNCLPALLGGALLARGDGGGSVGLGDGAGGGGGLGDAGDDVGVAGLGLGHVGVGVVGVGLGDGVDAGADARDHGGVRLGVVDRAGRGDDGVDEEGRRDDADGLLLWEGYQREVRLEGCGKGDLLVVYVRVSIESEVL